VRRRRRLARVGGQRGQGLVEYTLIAATIVLALAAISQTGIAQQAGARIDQANDAWNIRLPLDLFSGPADQIPAKIQNDAVDINQKIELQ
jgi:Flp pilus assembly pilin Flp